MKDTYAAILAEQLPADTAAQLVDEVQAEGGTPMDRTELERHISKGNLYAALLCYRPADNPHGKITGAELLPRIVDPKTGVITGTGRFYAAATEHRKWGDISAAIIDHALDIGRRIPDFHMSLNLSARMMDDASFVTRITELLDEHEIHNRGVVGFEVLEFVDTVRGSRAAMLRDLREAGIGIGLDDFGDGNSFRLLHEMHDEDVTPNTLKICARITRTASNGRTALRRVFDQGLTRGIRHYVAEGSSEYPIGMKERWGLAELQDEYPEIALEIEGPVVGRS